MGKYSKYTFKVGNINNPTELLKQFVSLYPQASCLAIEENWDIAGYESKWYTYKEELKEFSKLYPNLTFTIIRQGLYYEDVEFTFAKGGRNYSEYIQVINPIIDINKLQE